MTAHPLPEPAGPVQLLEADPGTTVADSRPTRRDGPRPGTRDTEESHLALVSAGAEDVSRIRHLAHDFLARRHVPPPVREDVLLIISELVTNAVTHALPPAALRLRCTPCSILRIEVTDGGPQLHQPPQSDPMEEYGRGMSIVAALAARHGTVTHESGATRWAEVIP
ncbi:ATP-binding protein [Streptomyces sp. PmtA]|uniref:ATP-binding protein n=1 Tax=Streptomyces sp. PmtA TaxID=3074275 RepID=UPI0030154446